MGYKDNKEYFWPSIQSPWTRHIFAGILKFFTQPLAIDRIGFCLLKMSDNLDLIQIEKFKNAVTLLMNASDDTQSVSSEDIIFTVHIG